MFGLLAFIGEIGIGVARLRVGRGGQWGHVRVVGSWVTSEKVRVYKHSDPESLT